MMTRQVVAMVHRTSTVFFPGRNRLLNKTLSNLFRRLSCQILALTVGSSLSSPRSDALTNCFVILERLRYSICDDLNCVSCFVLHYSEDQIFLEVRFDVPDSFRDKVNKVYIATIISCSCFSFFQAFKISIVSNFIQYVSIYCRYAIS